MITSVTFLELLELARRGHFRKAKHCTGFWEKTNGCKVVISHNGKEIPITGFLNHLSAKHPYSVQYRRGESVRYLPMHRVAVAYPERESYEKGFALNGASGKI